MNVCDNTSLSNNWAVKMKIYRTIDGFIGVWSGNSVENHNIMNIVIFFL